MLTICATMTPAPMVPLGAPSPVSLSAPGMVVGAPDWHQVSAAWAGCCASTQSGATFGLQDKYHEIAVVLDEALRGNRLELLTSIAAVRREPMYACPACEVGAALQGRLEGNLQSSGRVGKQVSDRVFRANAARKDAQRGSESSASLPRRVCCWVARACPTQLLIFRTPMHSGFGAPQRRAASSPKARFATTFAGLRQTRLAPFATTEPESGMPSPARQVLGVAIRPRRNKSCRAWGGPRPGRRRRRRGRRGRPQRGRRRHRRWRGRRAWRRRGRGGWRRRRRRGCQRRLWRGRRRGAWRRRRERRTLWRRR